MQLTTDEKTDCVLTAFYKLPEVEQNKLLFTARKLNDNRTKPLPDIHKIEILGKLGMFLSENMK